MTRIADKLMNNLNITPENLKALRDALRRHYGAIESIRHSAAYLNGGQAFSRDYIRRVLRGERNNPALLAHIADEAVRLDSQRKMYSAKVREAVSALA